jgi:sulfur carrier protein ThiS
MKIRLHLGGHLKYYDEMQRSNLEVEMTEKQHLEDILIKLKIPVGEIFLVSINGEIVSMANAWINTDDHVQLYPPMGGG